MTPALLAESVERFEELAAFDRLFFAFHTGEAYTGDERVTVVDPEKLPGMAAEAGLAGWGSAMSCHRHRHCPAC